jgi:hypothetical protein
VGLWIADQDSTIVAETELSTVWQYRKENDFKVYYSTRNTFYVQQEQAVLTVVL